MAKEASISEVMTFETEHGKLTYCVYRDWESGMIKTTPDGIHILKYEGKDEILELPKEINGISVVEVESLIKENSDIKKIIIPKSVQRVNRIAVDCPNLKEVVFSKRHTRFCNSAFIRCNSLGEKTTKALNKANNWAIAHTSNYGVIYGKQVDYIAVLGYDPEKNIAGDGKTVVVDNQYEGLRSNHIAGVAMEKAEEVERLVIPENIHINSNALKNFTSLDSHSMVQILKDHPDAFSKDLDVASVLRNVARSEQGSKIRDELLGEGARLCLGMRANSKELTWDQDKGLRYLTYSAAMGSKIAERELNIWQEAGVDIGESNRELLERKLSSEKQQSALASEGSCPAGLTEKDFKTMYYTGLGYLRGLGGVERNLEIAVPLIEEAARGGFPKAAERLASMYEYGDGVKIDYDKAAEWRKKADELSKPWFDKLVGKDDKGKEPKEREEPEIGE